MAKYTYILFLVIFALIQKSSYACDESSASLISTTDNGDGTYTVVIEICPEFLGLEGSPDSWSIDFNDPLNIISANPSTMTTGTGDNYNLSISGSVATWNVAGLFPSHTGTTFCNTVTLVVDGQPTTFVEVNVHDGYPSSDCLHTLTFPAICSISSVTATPSSCDPATNTYSVDVTITYANEPGSGTLNINGQPYTITGSPQTETITGLTADGSSQGVTTVFSADPSCTFTDANAYTAPTNCTPGCNANAGTISE